MFEIVIYLGNPGSIHMNGQATEAYVAWAGLEDHCVTLAGGAAPGGSVYDSLAGGSVIGEDIAGELYCTYYAPDGTFTHTKPRLAPQYGSWTVDGNRVCETMAQVTGCSAFEIRPDGTATITSLEGNLPIPLEVQLIPGDQCGQVSADPAPPRDFVHVANRWREGQYLNIERGFLESSPIEPGWWSAMWIVQ